MAFNTYMHERNIYRNQPDFSQIAIDYPAFKQYAIPDAKGKKMRVDFSNPDALRMLTEILLKKDFNLDVEIPKGFLIPTVPQRLNYILWMEDLLKNIPKTKDVISGIDIGTGPCAIFSLLGAQKNNWKFVATESSDDAIQWAKKNIEKNNLNDNIRVVKVNPGSTLSEILSLNDENYDFCLCNPPFFESVEEIRKKHRNSSETIADIAQREEIFFEGGESEFVKGILNDSLLSKNRICIFSSMFGKKKSFLAILKGIKDIKDAKVTTTEFCQGNTIRWGIAWTFNESIQFEEIKKSKKTKIKKPKPPLEYQIPLKDSQNFNLKKLVKQSKDFLRSLQIYVSVTRSSQYFAELLLKSDENTWTHQRRKRREMERQKKQSDNFEKKCTISSEGQNCPDLETVANSEVTPVQNVNANASEVTPINDNCADKKRNLENRNIDINITASLNDSVKLEANKKFTSHCINAETCDNAVREDGASCFPSEDEINEPLPSSNSSVSQNVPLNNKRKDITQDDKIDCKKFKTEGKIVNVDSETRKVICERQSDSVENSPVKNEINFEKNSKISVDKSSSLSSNSSLISECKNEVESIISEDNKMDCDRIDKFDIKSMSSSSCHDNIQGVSETLNDGEIKCDIDIKDLSEHKESRLDSKMDTTNAPEGSVLHCHLQLIKGKNNIYVKMNCSDTADRNSMYQVFQLIKNKIN